MLASSNSPAYDKRASGPGRLPKYKSYVVSGVKLPISLLKNDFLFETF